MEISDISMAQTPALPKTNPNKILKESQFELEYETIALPCHLKFVPDEGGSKLTTAIIKVIEWTRQVGRAPLGRR